MYVSRETSLVIVTFLCRLIDYHVHLHVRVIKRTFSLMATFEYIVDFNNVPN